jgi:hypothetical protein
MFDIQINGQSLDLDTNTVLTFEQQNPLFQTQVGAEGYSYPIDLPTSDLNKQIFGFVENIQSTTTFKDYPCQITINNAVKKATLSILKATNKYTCSLYIGLWDKKYLDKSLKDVNFGGIRNVGDIPTHATALINSTVETADYAFFPLLNRLFYTESSTQGNYSGVVNGFANGQFVTHTVETDNSDPQSPISFINQPTCYTPFPYLLFILKSIATEMGKTLTGSFSHNADIKQCVIYNTFALDELRIDPSSDLYGNLHATSINIKNHVPDITVRELLNALIVKFCLAITITDGDLNITFKQDALTSIEDDDYTQALENTIGTEPFKSKDTEGFTFTDVTDTDDQAQKDFENIIVKADKINPPVNNINQFKIPTTDGDIQFHVIHHEYYKATKTGGNTYATDYEIYKGAAVATTFKVGEAQEPIESKISTLVMVKNTPDINEFIQFQTGWLLPNAEQKGNSKVTEYEIGTDNPFTLRLLFYRGMQPSHANGEPYPLGTSDIFTANSNNTGTVGNLSLQWGGENGIYIQLHKKWLEKLQISKAMSVSLALTPTQWANFNFFKPKHFINQSGIIEKITISITPDGMRKATARILKM